MKLELTHGSYYESRSQLGRVIKSVFAERKNGSFGLWTFKMENKASNKPLGDFLVKTYDAEQYMGGRFWDRVSGGDLHNQKKKAGKMWKTGSKSSSKISKATLNKMWKKLSAQALS